MQYPAELADVASELITAWTCLDNIRLEALPSFAHSVESSAEGVAFPCDQEEVKTYQNEERAGLLESQAAEATILEERTSVALESFRSFCEILLLQCQEQSIPLVQLEPHLELPLYELLVEAVNQRRSPTHPDALRDYKSMQTNLRRAAHQAKLLATFYRTPLTELSIALYHHLVPTELKTLDTKQARNWIAIKACVEKVKQLEHFLSSSISASHGWFFSRLETQLLIKKLQLVIQYVVNDLSADPGLTQEQNTPNTAGDAIFAILALHRDVVLSLDLEWMRTVDNYMALVQDYNRDCFRDVMVIVTNRRRFAVQGDGNCFYRAVVKSFWSNVYVTVESRLAQELRKALNPPLNSKPTSEASTESKTAADPYAEFMIDDVTDRTTMAATGVWADHVQVKKMADYLSRPIWIARHDDQALKLNYKASDGEWDVSPGREYKLLPGPAKETNEPIGTLRPIVLFFTPEVHYDAFTLPHRNPYIAPISELEQFVLGPDTVSLAKAHNLVQWWFEVENDLANLLVSHQRALVVVEATDSNLGLRQDLANLAVSVLFKFTVLFHATRRLLSEFPDFFNTISGIPGGALTVLAVKPILDDELQMENVLLQWEKIKASILSLSFSLRTIGHASVTATTPLSSIFNRLTSFFESLTSPTLVRRDRSELTESQSGAALLLASLQEQFEHPPPPKRPNQHL